ncbi:hypothetical protein, partial [Bifidobacterium jacchi]|uniref:hypothetical protein n=1 Tax=Bifidobacterium jacchi TaxID=2490545 RepID=UPI0019D64DF9
TDSSAVCSTATVLQLWTRCARGLLARLSSSNVAYKQLCCLLHGNGPAIMDALRARFAGSPVGSHVAYRQLRCLLYGNVIAVPTLLG